MNKPITILGLGNLLLKDDGIGPRIIDELQKVGLPNGINAVTGGGSFYQYWEILEGSQQVIVVDALKGGDHPGTVYLLRPNEFVRENESVIFRHEYDFLTILDLMDSVGVSPEVIIVGVEPKEITYSLDLSPEIEKQIPAIIKLIRELCLLTVLS